MDRRNLLKTLGILPFIPLKGLSIEAIRSRKGHVIDEDSVVDGMVYQLVVYGATPGGIALAIRAAREGLTVLLVNHTQHLGGMFVNGLGTMDTLYNGARSPLYDELRYHIYDYYRTKYGKASNQYEAALPGFAKTKFESHVVEYIVDHMVGREPNIKVAKGFYPHGVEKSNGRISTVTFHAMDGDSTFSAKGNLFADCSYEGDLAHVSGVPMRFGRESQAEFGERHAGIAYMEKDHWPPSDDVLQQEDFKEERRLNLFQYDSWSAPLPHRDTGLADENIQAYNIRTTLTNNPENRIIPGKPKNYDPNYLKKYFEDVRGMGLKVPNNKTSWNHPELVGEQNKYMLGTWAQRRQVTEKFREVTLALLYFKQNDPSVPEKERNEWKTYGLPKDEYADNGHMPYELYVREGRRLVGKKVFTEHDASLQPGLRRAPIHGDSISVTEWFMDSHACTLGQLPGSKLEGEVMLKNKTYPGQVPLGTILTDEAENLLVPVCLSASHIGWGTIRLGTTGMSICEAAGYLAVLSEGRGMAPAGIKTDELVRLLASKRVMVSFFNDVEGREYAAWYPAVQYLGTQGFFCTYEAKAEEKLSRSLAEAWLGRVRRWRRREGLDSRAAAEILAAEADSEGGVTATAFAERLAGEIGGRGFDIGNLRRLLGDFGIDPRQPISRGNACILIFEASK